MSGREYRGSTGGSQTLLGTTSCTCAVTALDRHLTTPIQGSLTQSDPFQALGNWCGYPERDHAGFSLAFK